MGDTNYALHLIRKERLGNFAPFCFSLNDSFYHLCLLAIATLDSSFNIDVIIDKKMCHYIIDLRDSCNSYLNLLFII